MYRLIITVQQHHSEVCLFLLLDSLCIFMWARSGVLGVGAYRIVSVDSD